MSTRRKLTREARRRHKNNAVTIVTSREERDMKKHSLMNVLGSEINKVFAKPSVEQTPWDSSENYDQFTA